MTFDSMLQIPVTGARFYEHEEHAWAAGEGGIHVLDVDHVGVEVEVREGRVVLSGSGALNDGYGLELDLVPEAARTLARQLGLAAAELGPAG